MEHFVFPDIDPVALAVGPLQVRWYALAYLAGFLGGWWYAMRLSALDPDRRPNREDIDGLLPWCVLGVILGGRLGYVLFYNLPYYLEYPAEALQIWQGGMSFHGGLLGVAVAVVVFARLKKFSILALGDIAACVAPIGLFFGRIANFINKELLGRVTDVSWGVYYAGDAVRHPSALYEALLEGLVLLIVLGLLIQKDKIRRKPGMLFGIFLILYAASRIFAELFRMPDVHIGFLPGGVTLGQLLTIPMILVGGILIAYARRQNRPEKPIV